MLEITYTSSHTEKVRCFCLKMNNLASETEKAKIYGIEIKTKAKRDLIMKLKLKSSNTPHTLTHHIHYTHIPNVWLWLRFFHCKYRAHVLNRLSFPNHTIVYKNTYHCWSYYYWWFIYEKKRKKLIELNAPIVFNINIHS